MLKIGIIQQHNTPDISGNRNRLMQKIRALAADGAQLIVNQELHSISARQKMWTSARWPLPSHRM